MIHVIASDGRAERPQNVQAIRSFYIKRSP
jgi:hypothetical protein